MISSGLSQSRVVQSPDLSTCRQRNRIMGQKGTMNYLVSVSRLIIGLLIKQAKNVKQLLQRYASAACRTTTTSSHSSDPMRIDGRYVGRRTT